MLNIIAVMGRVVADPELRKTPNGHFTTTFTIACDRNFAPTGGERQTDFFEIVAWRAAAEFACKYYRKGQLVAVNGSLQTRSYEDKEGRKRKVYEIVADNLHFAEKKNDSQPATREAPPQRSLPDESELSVDGPDDFAIIDDSEDLPF